MNWMKARVKLLKLWLIAGGPKVAALGYFGVLLAALALQSWPGFQYAEWKLYDQSLKVLRKLTHQPVANDVVVIAADEASFRAFDEPFALWHKRLGALVDAMAAAQPAVVGLDIVLPSRSFDAVVPGIDRELMLPLLRARGKLNLVVAQTLDDDLQPRPIFPGFVALIGPQQLASGLVCLDEDSVVRRVMSAQCGNATAAGAAHQGIAQRMAAILKAPERGAGLIDFRTGDPFSTISMAQVLMWQAEGNTQKLRETFGGKAVLVGVVLPLEDRLRVPVSLYAAEPGNTRVPGVMLHAQILRSILNNGYIQTVPRWFISALTALACLCWFGYGFRKNLVYWTLFLMLPAIGLYALWLGYALSPAALLVSAKLAYVARQGLEAMRLSHQRNRLTQAFAGHVNPKLLQRVLATDHEGGVGELAPQRQQATVMWVQIPEHNPVLTADAPHRALEALSRYFDAVQQAVQRAGGMVDRFQGTGVLAYFGAPLPLRNPARSALEAALAITRSHGSWGQDVATAGGALPRLSIGIATGQVITGQAPMKKSSPFVVVGEPVDEAVRLASLAAMVNEPARVLVSDQTAAAVGEAGLQKMDQAATHGPATGGAVHYALSVR
ncbi:MAG: adenylate/guanylate cyclase domain-containing protein [Comamonadaceae bacterium]|nr:MAG: adenylate/guanylate cyclase domain-containing protein [Comamonadaceae bacterium]